MYWSLPLAALIFATGFLLTANAGDAQPAPADGDAEVLRLYDLSDLQVTSPREFPALALLRGELTATFAPHPPGADAPPPPAPTLDSVLATCFEPSIADLLRSRSALRDGRLLLVTANPTLHRHVEHAVAAVRRRQNLQVSAHIRLYAMPPQHRQTRYALPGLKWRPLPGQPGAAIADLTPSEQSTLIGGLGADKEVEVVTSPSVTAFAHQLASTTNIAQLAYLAASFTPKGPELKPSFLTIGDGTELRMTPTDDNLFIHLDLTYVRVALLEQKPIPWEGLADDKKPTLPVTASTTFRIDQALVNGHGMVMATETFMLQGEALPRAGFLIVDCTILDEKAREKQVDDFQKRKAELKAKMEKADAETKDAKKNEAAPPATKGADNF